jgi:hypothetical protein
MRLFFSLPVRAAIGTAVHHCGPPGRHLRNVRGCGPAGSKQAPPRSVPAARVSGAPILCVGNAGGSERCYQRNDRSCPFHEPLPPLRPVDHSPYHLYSNYKAFAVPDYQFLLFPRNNCQSMPIRGGVLKHIEASGAERCRICCQAGDKTIPIPRCRGPSRLRGNRVGDPSLLCVYRCGFILRSKEGSPIAGCSTHYRRCIYFCHFEVAVHIRIAQTGVGGVEGSAKRHKNYFMMNSGIPKSIWRAILNRIFRNMRKGSQVA